MRPSPHLGTLENRICDGVSTMHELAALTALMHCLVVDLDTRLAAGETLPTMPPWHVQENKWRAARYGLDAIIILDAASNERLITDDLDDLLERLTPVARRLGCEDELRAVADIPRRGASYQRQRSVAAATGFDLVAVVDSVVAELRAGLALSRARPDTAGLGTNSCWPRRRRGRRKSGVTPPQTGRRHVPVRLRRHPLAHPRRRRLVAPPRLVGVPGCGCGAADRRPGHRGDRSAAARRRPRPGAERHRLRPEHADQPRSRPRSTRSGTSRSTTRWATDRYALLFRPGVYGSVAEPLMIQVGYYTDVAGLGASPGDVTINGHVDVYNRCLSPGNCIALNNFWRSLSNLTINVTGGEGCYASGNFWAVSQAAPMRRVDVKGGNLTLMDYCSGPSFASGGFIADSRNTFTINGSQQQWLTRDSEVGGWSNGVWNQVFSGVQGAPAQCFPAQASCGGPYTTLPTTRVSREKPFLYVDDAGATACSCPRCAGTPAAPPGPTGPPPAPRARSATSSWPGPATAPRSSTTRWPAARTCCSPPASTRWTGPSRSSAPTPWCSASASPPWCRSTAWSRCRSPTCPGSGWPASWSTPGR